MSRFETATTTILAVMLVWVNEKATTTILAVMLVWLNEKAIFCSAFSHAVFDGLL